MRHSEHELVQQDVILVNDASSFYVHEWADRITSLHGISVVHLAQHSGFPKAANAGIKSALALEPDYIVVLNSDTVVTERWLDTVCAVGELNERFGTVSYTHLTLPTILRV